MGERRIDPYTILALPALAYFLVLFVVPLGLLLAGSVWVGDRFGLDNFGRVFGDSFQLAVIGRSIGYALTVSLGCLLVGFPFAYAMSRAGPVGQLLLTVAVVLPMTTSVIVRTFGWQVVLRSNGVINQALLGLGVVDEPLRLLFTWPGLILGTVSILLPYMVLSIHAVLRLIPEELMGVAASLGASPAYRLTHVLLPLSLPGVISGFGFVFSMAISAYVIPSLLTGAGYKVLSKVIANAFLVVHDPALGAAASVVLLAIAGSAIALAGWASAALAARTRGR